MLNTTGRMTCILSENDALYIMSHEVASGCIEQQRLGIPESSLDSPWLEVKARGDSDGVGSELFAISFHGCCFCDGDILKRFVSA